MKLTDTDIVKSENIFTRIMKYMNKTKPRCGFPACTVIYDDLCAVPDTVFEFYVNDRMLGDKHLFIVAVDRNSMGCEIECILKMHSWVGGIVNVPRGEPYIKNLYFRKGEYIEYQKIPTFNNPTVHRRVIKDVYDLDREILSYINKRTLFAEHGEADFIHSHVVGIDDFIWFWDGLLKNE